MNRPPPPPIALSAVFIVNLRGDVLIERQYRSDISRANIDMFKTEILSLSASSSSPFSGRKSSNGSSKRNASTSSKVDVQSLPPIRIVGQIRFMFIRVANVYVCAATKLNVNVSMCFAFLKSAIGTFQVRVELFFVLLLRVFSQSHSHSHSIFKEEEKDQEIQLTDVDSLFSLSFSLSLSLSLSAFRICLARNLITVVVLWESEREQHPGELCVDVRIVRRDVR